MSARSRLRPLVAATALVLAACAGGGDQTIESPPTPAATTPAATPSPADATGVPEPAVPDAGADCSAGELLAEDVEPQGLSDAAAATWSEIRDAALACDYDALAAIAGEDFSFTFGGAQDPAPHWREAEDAGERVLAELVGILELPAGEDAEGAFVWPRVHVEPEDDRAWEELLAVYPPEAIEEWRDGGSGYLGYRTSIAEDGTWRHFIAGD